MTEIKPEYKIKRMPGNGLSASSRQGKKERFFPVKISDNEKFLKFIVEYVKFPLSQGANQIEIHSDGMGNIMFTKEAKVNKGV